MLQIALDRMVDAMLSVSTIGDRNIHESSANPKRHNIVKLFK